MDLLSRGFSAVLGSGPEAGREDTTAGVVEKLCQRLSTSTLLQDRRDAMRALRSLSQGEEGYRVEVGAQALPLIVSCLEERDPELCLLTLEAIMGLIGTRDQSSELNNTFSEIVLKNQEVVGRIVEVSTETDIHTQLAGIRVVRALSSNRRERVQECLLSSPGALSHLVDLLDTQDVVRNEVLLVLSEICQGNPQIQKLLAFESGFDRLLGIVETEGCLSGGVIAQDCLQICISLLVSNSSNQSLFREGPYTVPIRNILQDATEYDATRGWDSNRTDNALLVLKLIRTLCSPHNPLSSSQQARASFRRGGLLSPLFSLMLSGTVPGDLLTETILTVADVIWGQPASQLELATAVMPGDKRSAVETLLVCMLNDKQTQQMRLACLYALQGHLVSNLTNQQELLSTLLPSRSGSSVPSPSSGRLLLAGLFGRDSVTCWCSSVLLVSALESPESREELLRVQLSTGQGQGSLVAMICQKVRDQLLEPLKLSGLLCLLSVWVHNCPQGAALLLRDQPFTDHLIAQIQLQPDSEQGAVVRSLCATQLGACMAAAGGDVVAERERVMRRIRPESLCDIMGYVLRSDPFIQAAKSPEPAPLSPSSLSLSYCFTTIARHIVDRATAAIAAPVPVKVPVAEPDTVLEQYKQLIGRQDGELEVLRGAVDQYRGQTEVLRRELAVSQQRELESSQLAEQLRGRVCQLEDQLTRDTPVRASPELEHSIDTSPSLREVYKRNELLEKEQEELLMYLADLDIKVRRYKTRLEEVGQAVSSSGDESESGTIPNQSDLIPQGEYTNGFHSNPEYADEGVMEQRLVPGTATHLFTPIDDTQLYFSQSVPPSQF